MAAYIWRQHGRVRVENPAGERTSYGEVHEAEQRGEGCQRAAQGRTHAARAPASRHREARCSLSSGCHGAAAAEIAKDDFSKQAAFVETRGKSTKVWPL